jgi:hypothetical protein
MGAVLPGRSQGNGVLLMDILTRHTSVNYFRFFWEKRCACCEHVTHRPVTAIKSSVFYFDQDVTNDVGKLGGFLENLGLNIFKKDATRI